MSQNIPLGPLVLALLGLMLLASSGYINFWGSSDLGTKISPELKVSIAQTEQAAPLVYHDPVLTRRFIDVVLARSPFANDRSAFIRNMRPSTARSEPEHNPRFVGVTGRGDSISVLILWEPGQPAQSHSIGDNTPWGILVSATTSKLVFENDEGRKSLELF